MTKILDIYNTYEYNFSFFGGEPLLNWDFIKQSLPLIRSDKRCKEILIPTNGLLLNQERYEFLKSFNVKISISFDGLFQHHNRQDVAGNDTFHLYIDKLVFFKEIVDQFKTMIHPENVRDPKGLLNNYKFFIENGFNNADFTIVRDDIWDKDAINN